MIFGVDFDGTFARDPELFRGFVELLRARGHDAVLVTGRSDEPPWGDQVRALVGDLMPIVFAADQWKRGAAECGRERFTGSGDMAAVALAAGTRVTLIPSKSNGIP